MLAHGEDEGIIDSEPSTLRLRDVEVVALSMRRRMTQEELVGWVVAAMDDGNGEGEGVWVIFDGVHEAAFTGVDFESPGAAVAGEVGFYCVVFLAISPFCLREGTGGDGIPTFEHVAVGVAGVGAGFDFGEAFDV